jgi:peptidyl-prolyl cis-trans isomerase D
VLNPIHTPLGWHVIRVISVTPARVQSFAEVRDDLRKELESDALHEEMEDRISKVDEMLGSGESLENTAAAMNLAVRTVGPIDAQGDFKQGETQDALLTSLGQNKDLLSSLFELMEGETGDLAEINEGLYAAFSLENVRPTRDRDFAEVRGDVEKKWLVDQRTATLNATVEKLMGELSRKEKDFAAAAKETGAVLKTARDVSRESKVAGLNDPVALTRLFDETDLSTVVKVPTEDGVILAKVLDARIPEAGTGQLSEESAKQLRTQMQQAVTALFISDMRERNKVVLYADRLEKIYGAEDDAQ